ncbi:MAG: hypothetical protein EXR79_00950 [Myxococcales bacterium]|nr:hypothetical protein [Myxococcales bacterium]
MTRPRSLAVALVVAWAGAACTTGPVAAPATETSARLSDTAGGGSTSDGAPDAVAPLDAPLDLADNDTPVAVDFDAGAPRSADALGDTEPLADTPPDVPPTDSVIGDPTDSQTAELDAAADALTDDAGDAAPFDAIDGVALETASALDALDTGPAVDSDAVPLPDAATAAWGKPVMPADLPQAAFADVTLAYGLTPSASVAPCVAVADFDNNGREDFLIVKYSGPKAIIHAVLLSAAAPVHVESPFDTAIIQPNFGCSVADLNGDAKPDLLVGGYSGSAFYLGDGAGGFVDKSTEWMPYITDFAAFSIQPADLDGDGDLDIFVGAGFDPPSCTALDCKFTETDLVCIVNPPPPNTPKLQDRVLIRGPGLPYVDETPKWNVPGGGTQTVALALDVDDDGKVDLLVGDDFGGHRLLHNKGGTFASFATDIGFHAYAGAMGWTIGEFDGDGLFDVVLAESGPTPLYVQKAPQDGKPFQVEDNGGELGSWWPMWGASAWAPLAADFDHDGQDDLQLGASVNFSPEKAADFKAVCGSSKTNPSANPFAGETSIDVLLLRKPGKGFTPFAMPAGQHPHVVMLEQRLIDLDADGDLDIVQSRPGPSMMASRSRILRNDLVKQGKSIQIVVKGKGLNQDALGTTVTATIGGKTRTRWLNGGSWGATPARFAHFGLGTDAKATDVTVRWPDGSKTPIGDVVGGETKAATWK